MIRVTVVGIVLVNHRKYRTLRENLSTKVSEISFVLVMRLNTEYRALRENLRYINMIIIVTSFCLLRMSIGL
jgi:hypothetical protein